MPDDALHEEFEHDSLEDGESIVKYLTAIAEGFRMGRIELARGGEEVVLEPSGLLRLNIRARRRRGKVTVSFRVSWKDGQAEPLDRPLVIATNGSERDGG